jgi:hypothetical protein
MANTGFWSSPCGFKGKHYRNVKAPVVRDGCESGPQAARDARDHFQLHETVTESTYHFVTNPVSAPDHCNSKIDLEYGRSCEFVAYFLPVKNIKRLVPVRWSFKQRVLDR